MKRPLLYIDIQSVIWYNKLIGYGCGSGEKYDANAIFCKVSADGTVMRNFGTFYKKRGEKCPRKIFSRKPAFYPHGYAGHRGQVKETISPLGDGNP